MDKNKRIIYIVLGVICGVFVIYMLISMRMWMRKDVMPETVNVSSTDNDTSLASNEPDVVYESEWSEKDFIGKGETTELDKQPIPSATPKGGETPQKKPVKSNIEWKLQATLVAVNNPEKSMALIQNEITKQNTIYHIGERVGLALLRDIQRGCVTLERDGSMEEICQNSKHIVFSLLP